MRRAASFEISSNDALSASRLGYATSATGGSRCNSGMHTSRSRRLSLLRSTARAATFFDTTQANFAFVEPLIGEMVSESSAPAARNCAFLGNARLERRLFRGIARPKGARALCVADALVLGDPWSSPFAPKNHVSARACAFWAGRFASCRALYASFQPISTSVMRARHSSNYRSP